MVHGSHLGSIFRFAAWCMVLIVVPPFLLCAYRRLQTTCTSSFSVVSTVGALCTTMCSRSSRMAFYSPFRSLATTLFLTSNALLQSHVVGLCTCSTHVPIVYGCHSCTQMLWMDAWFLHLKMDPLLPLLCSIALFWLSRCTVSS
jgi:hypothetical protein